MRDGNPNEIGRGSGIDALILDYGGVVIHEAPADHDAIGKPLGFAPGQLWAATHRIPEYAPSRVGLLSSAQYEAAVRAHLVEVGGPAAGNAAIDRLLDYYARNTAMRPLMQPLLAGLRGRVRLALLSNASRGSTAKFVARGLDSVFDLILCSGDVGVAKPDPAAYRLAAERLQLPLPRCAFVDDVEANVAAARARHAGAVLPPHAAPGAARRAARLGTTRLSLTQARCSAVATATAPRAP